MARVAASNSLVKGRRPLNRHRGDLNRRSSSVSDGNPEGHRRKITEKEAAYVQDGVAQLLTIQYFAREVEALWWTGRASFAKAGLLSDQPRRGAGSKAASMGV
jgi:hypothetical protein